MAKKVIISVIVLLLIVYAAGVVYESVMEGKDRELFTPPGQLVDVNGHLMLHRLHGPIRRMGRAAALPVARWG